MLNQKTALGIAMVTALLVGATAMAADAKKDSASKSAPAPTPTQTTTPVPTLPSVLLNCRLSTGNFIPMGAAAAGALKNAPPIGPNQEVHTLAIEMFNRTSGYLDNLEVRYRLYKVVVTDKTRKTSSGGVTYHDRSTNESPPKLIREGREKIALKLGERKVINAQATLFVPEDDNRQIIRNRNTRTTTVNTTREELYGYIVEIVQDGKIIVEKLSPSSIRSDVKPSK